MERPLPSLTASPLEAPACPCSGGFVLLCFFKYIHSLQVISKADYFERPFSSTSGEHMKQQLYLQVEPEENRADLHTEAHGSSATWQLLFMLQPSREQTHCDPEKVVPSQSYTSHKIQNQAHSPQTENERYFKAFSINLSFNINADRKAGKTLQTLPSIYKPNSESFHSSSCC